MILFCLSHRWPEVRRFLLSTASEAAAMSAACLKGLEIFLKLLVSAHSLCAKHQPMRRVPPTSLRVCVCVCVRVWRSCILFF